jgi:CRP-like cAMP-binding protein
VLQKQYGRGEGVGAVEMMTCRPRTSTLRALRVSEVIRIQMASLQNISFSHPRMMLQIARLVAQSSYSEHTLSASERQSSIKTLAVVPLSSSISGEDFCSNLMESIVNTGIKHQDNITILTSGIISQILGDEVLKKKGEPRLTGYLGHLEERMALVIFIPDEDVNSVWTEACIDYVNVLHIYRIAN